MYTKDALIADDCTDRGGPVGAAMERITYKQAYLYTLTTFRRLHTNNRTGWTGSNSYRSN